MSTVSIPEEPSPSGPPGVPGLPPPMSGDTGPDVAGEPPPAASVPRGPAAPARPPAARHAFSKPQTVGGLVYLVVLASAMVGLVIIAFDAWRTGLVWLGSGLVVASFARLVISEEAGGMLRVRRKAFDVISMLVVGVALVVLAVIVRDRPL